MSYSLYYQARVKVSDTWLVTATLRSFEHLAFDRTLDAHQGLFEFFVSPQARITFLEIINYFERQGIVWQLQQLPNRLEGENAQV